jgi:hypothetical protein
MAERDITVNINGNGSGGTGAPATPPEPPTTGGGDARLSASVSDLVSELRSALSQGGGPVFGQSGFKGYLDDVGRSIVTQRQAEIRNRFDLEREVNSGRYMDEVAKLDAEREARVGRYSFAPDGTLFNPEGKPLPSGKTITQDLDAWYNPRLQAIDQQYGGIDERLASEETSERAAVEREMTDALRTVAEELRKESREKSSGDEDSYIGRLRLQRKELVDNIERAATEEDYNTARKRLQEFDQSQPGASGMGVSGTRAAMAGVGMFSSAASGNIVGAAAGGAGLITAAAAGAAAAAVVSAVVAAIGYAISATSDRIEGAYDLANYRGLWGGRTGGEAMYSAAGSVIDASTRGVYGEQVTRKQLGIDDADFIRRATEMIATSGVLADTQNRVFYARANEGTYNLEQGALTRAARYERYGDETSSSAMIKLVDQLEQLNNRGIDTGIGGELGYARARERLEIQQQQLEYYYARYNRPDYVTANATQVAYSSQMGNAVQDARMGNAIQAVDSAIANGQGMQQAYTLMALQQSDVGKRLGLDKMSLSTLRWVPKSPQSFGLSEVELNTAVIQQLAQQGGLNPEEATWDELFNNPGINQYMLENFGNIPLEQLQQILPGLASGRTAAEYRKSVAAQRARPSGVLGEETLTEKAAHRQAQNVTDMAGLRTLAGEIQDSMKEFFTGILAKVSRDYMTDSNDVYKGEW